MPSSSRAPSSPKKPSSLEGKESGRGLLDRISDAYIEIDNDGLVHYLNSTAEKLFEFLDWQPGSLPVSTLLNQLQVNENPVVALTASWSQRGSFATRGKMQDGSDLDLQVVGLEPRDDGRLGVLLRDKAEAKPFQEELLLQREITQVVHCSVADGVITTDTYGCVLTINSIARELLGLASRDGVGERVDEILTLFHGKTHKPLPSVFNEALKRGSTAFADDRALLYTPERQPLPVTLLATPVRNSRAKIRGCVIVFRDVSDARRVSTKLSWQASHDALTQLPNRRFFEVELSRAVEAARYAKAGHGLIYIDLYQFKVVNDTCGHTAGDELLRQLSRLFSETLRSQDLLARLGSDEFGVLLRNCTLAGTQRVADMLLRAIEGFTFQWGNQRLKVGISVGAVAIDASTESDAQVLAAAEASCTTAKEAGRNRIHLYHHQNSQLVESRRNEMHWVARINEALAEDRLVLYRQAVVPVCDKALDQSSKRKSKKEQLLPHYEVLVRMRSHEGKIIAPGQFIPAAERYGLMEDIDRWVFKKLLQYLVRRDTKGLPQETYAINLAGSTLGNDSFRDFVLAELERTQVNPARISFEITETAAIGNFSRAVRFIETFREMGCKFYLDDFGSGLSSFAYLKDLPVDFLKIDGAFVRSMETDPVDYAMVSTINHLAQVMGIRTVAEYVENDVLLALLKEVGVDYAQGYGIEKPRPIDLLIDGE